jgi:hypothetical protein
MGVVRGSYGILPLTLARIRLRRCWRITKNNFLSSFYDHCYNALKGFLTEGGSPKPSKSHA